MESVGAFLVSWCPGGLPGVLVSWGLPSVRGVLPGGLIALVLITLVLIALWLNHCLSCVRLPDFQVPHIVGG